MHREMVHEIWTRAGPPWATFVKPVLFAEMPAEDPLADASEVAEPDLRWLEGSIEHTAFVVDLPGGTSVATGLALARRGVVPVPLFNACTGPHEVVSQAGTARALRAGAAKLAEIKLASAGPPAFLIDADREKPARPIMLNPGDLDNRSRVFVDDFPSATFLKERGIARAVLVRHRDLSPADDLAEVLLVWRGAGIEVLAADIDGVADPRPAAIEPPKWYRRLWRFLFVPLEKNAARSGGFGHRIPEPSRHHG